MTDLLAAVVGPPVTVEELKHKPGRRRTLRVSGSRRPAIVKVYESDRANTVAARIAALAAGPAEPVLPEVLALDEAARLVVLTEVPGEPLRLALLDDDLGTCAHVGAALARWHGAWNDVGPAPLLPHTAEHEVEILRRWAERAPDAVGDAVRAALPGLVDPWSCSTVVHRDLYEEQVLGADRIGLIDLDDAALGPPELDLGNLWAHADLLAWCAGRDLTQPVAALIEAYASAAIVAVDEALLDRCRTLSRLRLACIHREPAMLASPALG